MQLVLYVHIYIHACVYIYLHLKCIGHFFHCTCVCTSVIECVDDV